MPLTPSLIKIALDALKSAQCACGKPKVPQQAFCRRCYYALPLRLQSALWKCFSDGYAEAYDEAVDHLKHSGAITAPPQTNLFGGK